MLGWVTQTREFYDVPFADAFGLREAVIGALVPVTAIVIWVAIASLVGGLPLRARGGRAAGRCSCSP